MTCGRLLRGRPARGNLALAPARLDGTCRGTGAGTGALLVPSPGSVPGTGGAGGQAGVMLTQASGLYPASYPAMARAIISWLHKAATV